MDILKLFWRNVQQRFLGQKSCFEIRKIIGKVIELLLLAITFFGQNYWLLLLPIIFWRLLLLLLTIKNYYWGGSLVSMQEWKLCKFWNQCFNTWDNKFIVIAKYGEEKSMCNANFHNQVMKICCTKLFSYLIHDDECQLT